MKNYNEIESQRLAIETFLSNAEHLVNEIASIENSSVYIYLHACLNNALRASKSAAGIPKAEAQMRIEVQRYSGLISILNNTKKEDLMLQEVLILMSLNSSMEQTFKELKLKLLNNKIQKGGTAHA